MKQTLQFLQEAWLFFILFSSTYILGSASPVIHTQTNPIGIEFESLSKNMTYHCRCADRQCPLIRFYISLHKGLSCFVGYILRILMAFFLLNVFLGPHPQHMEVPRLGVESELQLFAYPTATAMPDPSHSFNLHHSSWQCQILNPLIKARDRTHNLMVPSWIC